VALKSFIRSVPQASHAGKRNLEIDYDLTAARNYLYFLAGALFEAATIADPRVVWLGVRLASFQGEAGDDR